MQRENGHSQEGGPRLRPCCKVLLVVLLAIFLGTLAGVAIRKVPGAPKKVEQLQEQVFYVLRHPESLKVPVVTFGAHGESTKTTSRRPLYECTVDGSEDWATGASVAKRDWCCENFGQGCRHKGRSRNGVSGAKIVLFECKLDRKSAWNVDQINWCCSEKGLGCPTTQSPEHRLNCSDVPSGGRGAWPAAKKQACHEAFQIPIVDTPSASDLEPHLPAHGEEEDQPQAGHLFQTAPLRKAQGDSYDCSEDTEHWMAEWSPTKKAWCCRHRGFACPPDPLRLK